MNFIFQHFLPFIKWKPGLCKDHSASKYTSHQNNLVTIVSLKCHQKLFLKQEDSTSTKKDKIH